MAIVIVGMLDEREEALRLIRDRIRQRGHETCLIDISVGSGAIVPTLEAEVTPGELADLAEGSAGLAVARGDPATAVATEGLKAKIRELQARGEVQGIIAITGMTGALISLPAMMELPFGIPKLLISGATTQPAHAARFGDYFSRSDITVMHSVVDTVGMNPLVRTLALNGADAVSGMVEGGPASPGGGQAVRRGDRVRLRRQRRLLSQGDPSEGLRRSFRSTRWGWATGPPWIWCPRASSRRSWTSCPARSASTFSEATGTRDRTGWMWRPIYPSPTSSVRVVST